MKLQSILFFTAVAAGTVQAGKPDVHDSPKPPKALDHEKGVKVHDDKHSYKDDKRPYKEDCSAYVNYPKFAGDDEEPPVPPTCREDGTKDRGWSAVKRQGDGGDSLRDDIGDAVNDVGDDIDNNDRNDNGPDGNDNNNDGPDGDDGDGPGNSAGGTTVPLLSVASVVAVSFLFLM